MEGAAAAPEQRLGKLSRLCVNQPGFERDGGQGEWRPKGKGRSASSDETPLPISRRGRRGYGRASRGDNAGGDKEALIGVVQELNASIADMSRTDIEMGRAAKTELLFRKPQLTLMKRSNRCTWIVSFEKLKLRRKRSMVVVKVVNKLFIYY